MGDIASRKIPVSCSLFVNRSGIDPCYAMLETNGSFVHCLEEARKQHEAWFIMSWIRQTTDYEQPVTIACSNGQDLSNLYIMRFPILDGWRWQV